MAAAASRNPGEEPSMHASVEYQRNELYDSPGSIALADMRTGSKPNPAYYEHQRVFELAEANVGPSNTQPLCERYLYRSMK